MEKSNGNRQSNTTHMHEFCWGQCISTHMNISFKKHMNYKRSMGILVTINTDSGFSSQTELYKQLYGKQQLGSSARSMGIWFIVQMQVATLLFSRFHEFIQVPSMYSHKIRFNIYPIEIRFIVNWAQQEDETWLIPSTLSCRRRSVRGHNRIP